jgi:hypothetical protein
MRLDADPLRWFRQQRGYQTRTNASKCRRMGRRESGVPPPKSEPRFLSWFLYIAVLKG